MKNLFKPASLLLYLLTFLNFFLIGVSFSKIIGATEGQGLASGAIVLGYGMTFAIGAFILAVVSVNYLSEKSISKINRLLVIVLLILISYYAFAFFNNKKNNETGKTNTESSTVTLIGNKVSGLPLKKRSSEETMGLGFFKPDFINAKVLYFYSYPVTEKLVSEHIPIDSLGFGINKTGGIDISYAPPWLMPEHLKLDYEIFYFKIMSLTKDFAEVMVNDVTENTMFLARNSGNVILWPDFLLQVHSVGFLKDKKQIVRVKPLSYAGEINKTFEIMKPVLIKEEWMQVEMFDENYESIGKGWIQWRSGNELLIDYSLLS